MTEFNAGFFVGAILATIFISFVNSFMKALDKSKRESVKIVSDELIDLANRVEDLERKIIK